MIREQLLSTVSPHALMRRDIDAEDYRVATRNGFHLAANGVFSWLRPTDQKWRDVADEVGCPAALAQVLVGRAAAFAAFEGKPAGSIGGFDVEKAARQIDGDPDEARRVWAALSRRGVIVDNRFAAWPNGGPR